MLDIKIIRETPDLVKTGIKNKGFDPTLVDELLLVDEKRRGYQSQAELLRAERNSIGSENRDRAVAIKAELEMLESDLNKSDEEFKALMLKLPNIPEDDVPVGEGESANTAIRTVGEKPNIDNPKDHVELAEALDLIDTERGSKVAGARFNFLKNQAVILELGLVRFAMDLAVKHGFAPMMPPVLVNEKTVLGTGYLPHGADEVYKTQDDLYLIGTSELALVAYHQDEVLAESQLPLRYVGFSTCFRREAGSYGKDMRGIVRQHQFDKVELVSLVKPEDSVAELAKILAIEEELMQTLELPYHVLEIGTGDLGIQASKKFDIEMWMPGQDKYRETHSCSNTTDFQSRRLNIRYKNSEGKNEFVHTLNGTAIAIQRFLVGLIENGQQPDGSIKIPAALVPYVGCEVINNISK
jgi:seryl-tRNA synthetase